MRTERYTRDLDAQFWRAEQFGLPAGVETIDDPVGRRCNNWAVALIGPDKVLAAGGLIPIWPGRAEAWLLVSSTATPRDLVPAIRLAREVIAQLGADPAFRRIEAYVRWDAPWRDSFARSLGLALEAFLPCWEWDGADHGLYTRIYGRDSGHG